MRSRTLIAEFANAESVFRTNGWTEDPAGHGTRFVEVAGSGSWIEDGTGLIVGKISEAEIGPFSFF